jgi:hypothetical protein
VPLPLPRIFIPFLPSAFHFLSAASSIRVST